MIAICLASLALLLVLIAYVGGLVNRVVVEYVHDADAAALVAINQTTSLAVGSAAPYGILTQAIWRAGSPPETESPRGPAGPDCEHDSRGSFTDSYRHGTQ